MILTTRQSLNITTIDAASSSTLLRPEETLVSAANFEVAKKLIREKKTAHTNVNDETRNDDRSIEAVEFGFEESRIEQAVSNRQHNLQSSDYPPQAKGPNTSQQLHHKEATEHQTHDTKRVLGPGQTLPDTSTTTVVAAGVIADVKADEEIGKDARDVQGDEQQDGIVAVDGREEAARLPAGGVVVGHVDGHAVVSLSHPGSAVGFQIGIVKERLALIAVIVVVVVAATAH